MKLGLLADIHEHVDHLKAALRRGRDERVDQFVVLGDVFDRGDLMEEVCGLLADAKAVGVWGNHDFGLCHEPHPIVVARYPASVLGYMGTLQPRLVVEDCQFSHIEPWLNPSDLADLWFFDGPPDSQLRRDQIFQAAPHRLLFAGHYHLWLAATPTQILPWQGERPLRLDDGRFFIVVNAVREGHFATYDTATSEFTPMTV